jgi:cytochrome c-type biogenesis protein CcmF
MAPLIAVMAVGPMLAWKRGDLAGVLARLAAAAIVTVVVIGVTFAFTGGPVLAVLGVGLAAWLALGTASELAERIRLFRAPPAETLRRLGGLPRAAIGMTVAHGAMAVIVLGITASSAWQSERILAMTPGQAVEIAGYRVTLDRVERIPGPNYLAERATLTVTRNGAPVTVLRPEKRAFTTPRQTTTEAAIHTTFMADLYAVLGDPTGAVIMVAGGLVSLTDRRHRVGAPSRKARGSADAAVPGAA